MLDKPLVHGAKDGGERPTVQSLRNRLRTEYENDKDAAPRRKKSWLSGKVKPSGSALKSMPGSTPAKAETAPVSAPSAAPRPPPAPADAPPDSPRETPAQDTARPARPKPDSPRKNTGRSRFSALFAKLAKNAKPMPAEHNLSGFLDIFKEGLRLPPPIIAASIVSSLLGLALPLSVLQIYDRILPNQSVETLTLLTIGLFAAFALDAVLKVLRSYILGWNAVRSGFDAQLTAITRLLKAPHARVEKEPPAIWVDGLEAVRELSVFEGGQSRLLTLDIPLASIFLIVLGLVGGPLIIVPILLIAGFGVLAVIHGVRLRQILTNRSEQDNRKHDFLVECLRGIHTLKGLAMEPMILRRFERLQKGLALANHDTILLGNTLQSTSVLFANLMMISVVSVGALLVMTGKLSIGGLACCSLLSGRLTQPVLRGIGMWTEFQNIQLAQQRAGKFDDLEVGADTASSAAGEITGSIELNDVGFEYPGGNKRFRLTGISLQVRPGEFVGIKGEDGSGRSTLVKLITGEIKPTTGAVVIGGLESCPDTEQLQVRDVAYVSAKTATFRGTILENITMFRTGAAIEAAQRAAKLIGLEDEIHRLPDGYDTPLAQGVAQTLSTGLLQRVAIARALARNPKILIFDEANTLLDFQSDAALRRGLESLKGAMTAIIISNRPSFLSIADRVYALKDGTLELQPDMAETSAAQAPAQGAAA